LKLITAILTIVLSAAIVACGGGGSSSRTPLGVISWQQVTLPSGVSQLNYVAFNGSGHWFIADRKQGFFRSTDQGATWTAINSGLSTTLGWTINVNPANGDLIASTYSGGTLNAHPVTFYRSSDEGASWTVIPSSSLSAATAQTGCAFAGNGNVVCGGYWAPSPSTGAWVSSDGGQTTASGSTSPNVNGVFGLGYNSVTQDLWLGTEQNGIYRSTDNGLTWTQASPADQQVDPANGINDGNIFAITFDRSGNVLFGSQGGIWKSSKSGTGYTWSNVLKNPNTSSGKGLGRDANGHLFYGHNHDTQDPTVVHCSSDDGNSWSACDSGIPASLEGHEFVVNPSDQKMYAVIEDGTTNNGSLFRTTNPVQ
jgi:hypothetical protein